MNEKEGKTFAFRGITSYISVEKNYCNAYASAWNLILNERTPPVMRTGHSPQEPRP